MVAPCQHTFSTSCQPGKSSRSHVTCATSPVERDTLAVVTMGCGALAVSDVDEAQLATRAAHALRNARFTTSVDLHAVGGARFRRDLLSVSVARRERELAVLVVG